jgi:enoyl-CoA hydratase/carnithine racemase
MITYDSSHSTAILTINRPLKKNALDLATLKDLRNKLMTARDDEQIKVIILTGSGNDSFCAGSDLKSAASSSASYAEAFFKEPNKASEQGLYVRLIDLTDLNIHKPLIGVINGYCLGGGLELALQCDLRVASDNATFGLPEAKVASVPGVSGVHRLLKAIPSAHAMKLALTGEPIKAIKALDIGLISDIFNAQDLLGESLKIAQQIASNGPLATQAIKKLSKITGHLSDIDAQQITELYWGVLRDTEDRIEGRQAFMEKRTPNYKGK